MGAHENLFPQYDDEFAQSAREEAVLAEQHELISAEIQEAEKAGPPPLDSLIEDVTQHIHPHLREQLADVRPFFVEGGVADGEFPL